MTPPHDILLTGATGFLGNHLIRHFAGQNIRIGAIVRPGHVAIHDFGTSVQTIPFEQRTTLDAALSSFKDATLIHCAAYTGRAGTAQDIALESQSNLAFPVQVFEACRAAGLTRFINIGSFWEHDENGAIAPPNSYAAMKLAFQTYLDFMSSRHGLSIATLKLSETYAECDTRAKVIPLLCNAILSGTRLEMSEGTQQSSFCHVSDVVRAFEATANHLRKDTAHGKHQVFHVNSGVNTSIRNLAKTLSDVAAPHSLDVAWGALPARVGGLQKAWIDGPRPPDWAPQIALHDGLKLVWERTRIGH